MATHASILAWRIPMTEEPGGLQSMGLKRVGHNLCDQHTEQLLVISAAVGWGGGAPGIQGRWVRDAPQPPAVHKTALLSSPAVC